jgi:hypothetical protein
MKNNRPKIRYRSLSYPLRFITGLGINPSNTFKLEQMTFSWFFENNRNYKVIHSDISLTDDDYVKVELKIEKLQNRKSYYTQHLLDKFSTKKP